jgi:cytochrome oxidase Cu insertion factor (SCO1/SenC/PrrC family)
MRAAVAGILAVTLAVAGLAPVARGDGDPASDVLLTQQAFFAAQTSGNLPPERELLSTLNAAKREHFPIRVAIISSEYDLGSITALWHRPRVYSQFLGIELSDAQNQRLLVVMPNGFGFDWPGHSDPKAYRLLAHIPIGHGASGLASAARAAVVRLASADGIRLTPAASSTAAGSGSGVLTWLLFAIVLTVIAAAISVWIRRRRRSGASGAAAAAAPKVPAAGADRSGKSPAPRRWAIPGAAALLLAAIATPIVLVVSLRGGAAAAAGNGAKVITPPPVAWAAGRRAAPGFVLRDQNGDPVSLARFRGRPVIVTFVDPLCRNLCPLEAHLLNQVVASMPVARRPAIVAVSVDVYADSRADLEQDEHRWELVPQWHWAVGNPAELASVWRRYQIGVQVVRKQIDSTKINYITHTEAAYVIDASGHERALFLWPFYPQDVERVLQRLS